VVRLAVFTPVLLLPLLGASGPRSTVTPDIRIAVVAPHAPIGTAVRIRFVSGPDSLRGTERTFSTPFHLRLQASEVAFVVERADAHGTVQVDVEAGADGAQGVTGQGIGDRVRIELRPGHITVRTLPRSVQL
jgi:hypothetical protein